MLAVDVPIESVNQCPTLHTRKTAVEIQRPQTGRSRRGRTLHDLDKKRKTLVAKPLLRFPDSISRIVNCPCVVHQTPFKFAKRKARQDLTLDGLVSSTFSAIFKVCR